MLKSLGGMTTVELKKELIPKWEKGTCVSDLAVQYGMAKSTVSTILKNREAIKAADVAKGVKSLTSKRLPAVEEVEKEEENNEGSITTTDIKELLGYWSKTQNLVEKWHPNVAVVNRCINLFDDNVMQHFHKILKSRQRQMTLDRFFSRKISNDGSSIVSESQPSTSGFKER